MNLAMKLAEIDKHHPRRILVIGDAMTDVYVDGEMHSSCQEGCTKFVEKNRTVVPGGAANAARSLKHWFSRAECIYDWRCGPTKTRFQVSDKTIFRHDIDGVKLDLQLIRNSIRETLERWKPEGVLISDYDKGLLTPEFIRKVINYCTENKIPCVSDAKREPQIYRDSILKCNSDYGAGRTCLGERWVITQGYVPPYGYDKGTAWTINPSKDINCINHVGAGDCFAAHLTLGLACGLSLKEAAEVAHSAGRVYVQHRYNEPPKRNAIIEDMGC